MNKLFSASISTMALFLSPGLLLAQPDIDTVRIRDLTWMPCDPNASDRACQLAVIHGTTGKDTSDGKVVLIMIKGTAAIDADRGQEQEPMPGSGDYVYIPPSARSGRASVFFMAAWKVPVCITSERKN